MTLESNKQLARDILKAATSGDVAALDGLMTDDATWWLVPSIAGLAQKQDFLKRLPYVWSHLAEPLQIQLLDITAEDDRVSVTFTGQAPLKNGRRYDNHFHILFKMRDGKMASAQEYFDSAHALEVFGKH